MRLVGEADCDARATKGPKLLDQPVIQLFLPFASEKLNDLLSPGGEFGAITPLAVEGISEATVLWVARVPAVLGLTNLQDCCLLCERWDECDFRFTAHSCTPSEYGS